MLTAEGHPWSHQRVLEAGIVAFALVGLLEDIAKPECRENLDWISKLALPQLVCALAAIDALLPVVTTRYIPGPVTNHLPSEEELQGLADQVVRLEMTRVFDRGWHSEHLAIALDLSETVVNEIEDWVCERDVQPLDSKPWYEALRRWLLTYEPTEAPWKIREDLTARLALDFTLSALVDSSLDIVSSPLPPTPAGMKSTRATRSGSAWRTRRTTE